MMLDMRKIAAIIGKRAAMRSERIVILAVFCWMALLQNVPLPAGRVATQPSDSEQLPFHDSPMPASIDVDEVESLTSDYDHLLISHCTLVADCKPILPAQLHDASQIHSPCSRTLLFELQRLRI